jgi:DNA polymerase-3 subunit alpha
VGLRTMNTRRGDRMAFVTLDDRTGRLELAVFADLYGQHRELLRKDALLVVEGQVSVDEYSGGFKMSADRLYDMDGARKAFASRLVIDVGMAQAANGFVDVLQSILGPGAQDGIPVRIHYRNARAEAELDLGSRWKVDPTTDMLERLRELAGTEKVRVIYGRRGSAPTQVSAAPVRAELM